MGTDKTKEVLNHLKTYGSITSLEAINLFSATRLSAIIYNLRHKGYNITSKEEKTIDKYGHPVKYARYTLGNSSNNNSSSNAEENSLFKELFDGGNMDESSE